MSTVEHSSNNKQFHCHVCNKTVGVEVDPTSGEIYCNSCGESFIEEIEQQNDNDDDDVEEEDDNDDDVEEEDDDNEDNIMDDILSDLLPSSQQQQQQQQSQQQQQQQRRPNVQYFDLNSMLSNLPNFFGSFNPVRNPNTNNNNGQQQNQQQNQQQQQRTTASPFATILQQLMGGVQGNEGGFDFLFPGMRQGGIQMGDYVIGDMNDIVSRLMTQFDGRVGTPPASQKAVDSLEEYTVTQSDVDKELDCSVCQDKFKLDEKLVKLPCNHLFHKECVLPWLKEHSNCPVCRYQLETNDEEYNQKNLPNNGNNNNNNNSNNNNSNNNNSNNNSSSRRSTGNSNTRNQSGSSGNNSQNLSYIA